VRFVTFLFLFGAQYYS